MASSRYIDNAVPAATEADARAQLDRWAQEIGFASLDAYLDQLPDSDSIYTRTADGRRWRFRGRRVFVAPPQPPRPEYRPNAEELAAARRELGIDAREAGDA